MALYILYILLHEVFKSDATDVILQHSLIISVLRVAKWWQNDKIGPENTLKHAKKHQICARHAWCGAPLRSPRREQRKSNGDADAIFVPGGGTDCSIPWNKVFHPLELFAPYGFTQGLY